MAAPILETGMAALLTLPTEPAGLGFGPLAALMGSAPVAAGQPPPVSSAPSLPPGVPPVANPGGGPGGGPPHSHFGSFGTFGGFGTVTASPGGGRGGGPPHKGPFAAPQQPPVAHPGLHPVVAAVLAHIARQGNPALATYAPTRLV